MKILQNHRTWEFLILCLLVSQPAAASATEDVLRIYWDVGQQSILTTTPTIPDTITAYVVLENPSGSGSLASCFFNFRASNSTVVGFDSDMGPVEFNGGYRYDITATAPVPLLSGMVLAEFQLAVNSQSLDQVSVTTGLYYTDTGDPVGTRLPYATAFCAWINPGTPLVRVETDNLVFGPQGTNRTVTLGALIENDGDAPVFLTTSFGPDCEAFSVANPEVLEMIAPYDWIWVNFTFAPTTPGAYSCVFQVTDEVSMGLQGTGRVPILSLTGPPAVDFGTVAIGGIDHRFLEVSNDGDFPVTIPVSDPMLCSNFNRVNPPFDIVINPDRTESFNVAYTPANFGPHNCPAVFADSLLTIMLTGSGMVGTVLAEVTPDTLHAYAGPGLQDIALFFLANLGDVALAPDFQIVGGDGAFALYDSIPFPVWPGRSEQYGISFNPTETRLYNAQLLLGEGLPVVTLVGHGQLPYPAAVVTPSPAVFSPTNPLEIDTLTVQVTNTGNSDLLLSTSLSGLPSPNLALIGVLDQGAWVRPGRTVPIRVSYQPLVYGQFDFRLHLYEDLGLFVDCIAPPRLDFAPDENHIGVFFDPGFSLTEKDLPIETQVVNGYLVLQNPSETLGISGWECRVETSAGAALIGATPTGGLIDAVADVNEFVVVSGGSPLPYSPAVLLADLQILLWDLNVVDFAVSLLPTATPTIPGMMVWTSGAVGAEPLPMVTVAPAQTEVAWLHLVDPVSGVPTETLPRASQLLPNVPNPFNPQTRIHFELAVASPVQISIYDVTGRVVRRLITGDWSAGSHHAVWDGRDDRGHRLPSGAYYVRLKAGEIIDRRKVMLVK